MTETIDNWMHNPAYALGVGFAEVIGSRGCLYGVAGIAEPIKGSASRQASSLSQLLGLVLSVWARRIAAAPDPRVAEHHPRKETHDAPESEYTDDDHCCSCAAS